MGAGSGGWGFTLSGAFLEMRAPGKTGRVSLNGLGNEGIPMEEMKELCPGCWGLSMGTVTVTGSGQRKNLGLEVKPLISGRKRLGGLVGGRWLGRPGLQGHGGEGRGHRETLPLSPCPLLL